jgi:hypothetical protein
MRFLIRTFISWLPLGIAITAMCLLVYGAVQQNYHSSLDDPQIQMAQDVANAIASGASVQSVVPSTEINIAQSLAPWIAVYDANDNPIASDATLDGAMPQPPKGEFDLAKSQGNNLPHNTWQPDPNVRQALVVVPISTGGYVAAGRNMSEVENR